LTVTPKRLELRVLAGEPQLKGGKPVAPELARLDVSSPPGGRLNQPLFRAVGLKKGSSYRPRVLDATAGFGEDAWLLASKGCPTLAIERNSVIATLLRDALRRVAEMQPVLAQRISVLHEDSREVLRAFQQRGHVEIPAEQPWHSTEQSEAAAERPAPAYAPAGQQPASTSGGDTTPANGVADAGGDRDEPRAFADYDREAGEADAATPVIEWPAPDVVYIDPMFPTGRRAMERKPLRVLRKLVGGDIDSGELLALSLKVARHRVVAKRPRKAPPLGGREPTTYHRGRSLRYDVYVSHDTP
jgi:hypothetical protein